MPKASRGRRPGPNPKKRARRYSFPSAAVRSADPGSPPVASASLAARPLGEAATPRSPVSMPRGAVRRAGTPAVARRRFSESVADYWYVASDLRRIGFLAGGLVVLLVTLSFIVR